MLNLEQMRNELFFKESKYHEWSKKINGLPSDPFLSKIFSFLAKYPSTKQSYEKLIENGSSHRDFCNGKLRSDGYYPLRSINECIYANLCDNSNNLENSSVICDIADGYQKLSQDFSIEMQSDSLFFKTFLNQKNCFYSEKLYSYLQNLLKENKTYSVLAWMTIIAIFPFPTNTSSKNPNYTKMLLKNIFQSDNLIMLEKLPSLHQAVDDFLTEELEIPDEIEQINLAFNHGVRWLTTGERNQLLRKMTERTNKMQILLTEYSIAEEFTKHIRKPYTSYVSSYLPPLVMWKDFCNEYSDKITLKISHVPLMRQYTEFQFHNQENSALYVGFYTYGGITLDRSQFMILSHDDSYFQNYQQEFQYLWNLAKIAEFHNIK